jgi:YVTN family beta-propeller protein
MRRSVALLCALAAGALLARQAGVFTVLKSSARIGRQAEGFYLLPTNQLLRPWGELAAIRGRPVDLAFDSGRRLLAVLNTRSVLLLDGSTGVTVGQVQTRATSYTGLAFRPGDRELWASETSRRGPDSLAIIPLTESGQPGALARLDLPGHPVPAGIAFSPEGAAAYVALSGNNSLGVVDARSRRLVREVAVGVAPFGVAVSSRLGKAFVTNRGGRRPVAGDTVAPSSGSPVLTDPKTGAALSGTLSVVDLRSFAVRDIAVGLAPSAVALSPDERTIAVANSHSDSVSVIDAATLARKDVQIPTWPAGLVGSQPVGLAFAPDGKTLYVACGGNNAVAVLTSSGAGWRVAGAVPAAWFPSGVAVDRDGSLRVISIKGLGNTAGSKGSFNSREYEGSLERIPRLERVQIAAGTREVEAANSPKFEPAGGVARLDALGIRHVFFIIKENRTYDQVLGDLPQGNGDPNLVMYGRDITPNHHALAERYVLLDNFHTGGAISFDGHQWLMQAFVSDYVERAFAASPRGYAWNMSDALTVSPAGFFWQSARRPLDVRIYGEFSQPARWDPATQTAADMNESELMSWGEYWRRYQEGTWRSVVGSRSGVPALQHLIDPQYPCSDTSIPDQLRGDEFLRDFGELDRTGRVPGLSIIHLNSDHTNGTRPGSPTPRAMVADNDLALGRIVEGISRSRVWPASLVLVVEDDAQDGLDHVDGHRTVALAAGPFVRRKAVDSNHYNQVSMVKTIQEIFRIPPRTRYLATARAMTSLFTTESDAAPYQCLTPKVALDEMNPPLRAVSGRKLWAARQSLAMNWREPDDIPADVLNRILWWDAKGYDRPYPAPEGRHRGGQIHSKR